MTAEEWRHIYIDGEAWPYEVSSLGRVKSSDRMVRRKRWDKEFQAHLKGRILKPYPNPRDGYLTVVLSYKGEVTGPINIATLVCEAFHGPRPSQEGAPLDVCHYPDNNKENNRADNLMWGSRKINLSHREAHGTLLQGQSHPNWKHGRFAKCR